MVEGGAGQPAELPSHGRPVPVEAGVSTRALALFGVFRLNKEADTEGRKIILF